LFHVSGEGILWISPEAEGNKALDATFLGMQKIMRELTGNSAQNIFSETPLHLSDLSVV